MFLYCLCTEQILVALFVVAWIFVTSAIMKYLPRHVQLMTQRAMYYIYGQEGDPRLLWQWLGAGSGGDIGRMVTSTINTARTAAKAGSDL